MSPRGIQVLKAVLSNLKCRKPKMPYYAVARGREVGVFQSWNDCQEMILNFKGAKYKKFESKDEAWDFVKQFRYKSIKPINEVEEKKVDTKDNQNDVVNLSDSESEPNCSNVSSDRFDFAAFSLRLTKLENTFQEKIRSLEERVKALENGSSAGCDTGDRCDKTRERPFSDPAPGASNTNKSKMSATKRKLLETANDIIKPGSSRSFSTSASKKLKILEAADPSANPVPFQLDSEDHVKVYTDGACPNNSNKNAKAGIGVWFNDGHPLNVSAPVTGRATNNVAELQAATVAVQVAAGCGITKLCIITDSQFMINCMTDWIHNWKKNNWKTGKCQPVINKEEILELEKACKCLESVKWVHVRGHQGIHGNECADQLARNGAEFYRPP